MTWLKDIAASAGLALFAASAVVFLIGFGG